MTLSIYAWAMLATAGILFVLGCLLTYRSAWPKHLLRLVLGGAPACFFLVSSILIVILTLELNHFSAFQTERPYAKATVHQVNFQEYELHLVFESDSQTDTEHQGVYLIRGDEWRLESRIIRWQSWLPASLFEPLFQLERLEGRYRSVIDQKTKSLSVHGLTRANYGVDFWSLASQGWIPGVAPQQGVGAYMPLVDEASYEIYVDAQGIRILPANAVATEATKRW